MTTPPKPTPFRRATSHDVALIHRQLKQFYAKQGHVYAGIPFDTESAVDTIMQCILAGICLVGPTSCAGAVLTPFPYNRQAIVANVVFWYSTNHEIEIFKVLGLICKAAGATHISATSHPPEHRIARYYKRLGLTPAEQHSMCPL